MVRRWQQLPLDRALSGMPRVRLLLADLADLADPADPAGPAGPVPDLGPAVVMDQLTVLVYDACESGGQGASPLAQRLGDLLRDLG